MSTLRENPYVVVVDAADSTGALAPFSNYGNATGALPVAYAKRVSENPLLAPAATAYRGTFYVMALSTVAPYRVFGATTVETVY